MKNSVKFIVLIALAVSAAWSCSSMIEVPVEPEANEYWQGKTHAEIIRTYGAPDREASDGAGGKIIIYETETTTVTNYNNGPVYDGFYGFYYHMAGPMNMSTRVETEVQYGHFYVGADGICYKVETNLTRQVDKKQYRKENKN